MVTKGIIQTLDLLGNTCTVRMPLFETSGNDEIIGTATISNTPGSYNGYRVGDVVWIAFEDGQMNTPVVIGKLYLGAEAERNDPRGIINVESSTVTKNATVPADTKLSAQIDSNVPNTTVPYGSLSSIANNLNTLNINVAQNDRDYGNRFKQIITEVGNQGKNFETKLEQTAKNITAEVAETYVSQDGKSELEAFGWSLKKDGWTVYKEVNEEKTNILEVNKGGLSVRGDIKAESGHIGSFEIGKTHNCPILDVNGNPTSETIVASGIYSNNYIKTFEENTIGKKGVYIGTDGIKLGTNFSVDTNGEVIARSLKIGNITDPETADLGVEITDDGKVKMTNLVTDQLAVYTKDDENTPTENEAKPILLVNVDENGNPTEGKVQIGGFNVSENTLSAEGKIKIKNLETNDEEEVESKVSISTDAISVGPVDQTNNNIPLVISGTGEIIASKGSFSGQITASGAELKDTSYFSMADDGEALFNTLNATTISASDNISTKGRINSNSGYFFGPDATCGLSLVGTVQYIEQDCIISISTSHMLVGSRTNDRYRITVSCSQAATKPIKVTFSKAQWGDGTNAITIEGSTLTINAGSESASTQRTITNTSKYQLIYTTYANVNGGIPAGGTNNPTKLTTEPLITQIEVDGKILYSAPDSGETGKTSYTIKQTTPSSSSNLKLDCKSFQMNGNIIIPNNATFNVKGDGNANVVTLSKVGLQTDGAVRFKVGSDYYEPAIRLMTDGSPNCFWSKAFEIGGGGGSGWKSVTLPSELQDSDGSSGDNSKIIAILATGKFPKDVDKKDPNSGDAQGATFYTWWDKTKAYVYNPISKAPSNFVINIVVLGKI